MIVKRITNHVFNSNTYILSEPTYQDVWIIDVGDTEKIIDWLEKHNKSVKGVLITHSHFDHIYGLNKLLNFESHIPIYISEKGKEGLFSERLNLSFYGGHPFIYKGKDVNIIRDSDIIVLWQDISLKVIESPGHDYSCLSFIVDDYIFSGDSHIPGIPVVKNLPNSNKKLAIVSEEKIINYPGIRYICPGHGEMYQKNL